MVGDEDLKNREIEGGHNTEGVEGVEKPTEDVKNGGLGVEKATGKNGDSVLVGGESKAGDGFDEKKGDSSSSGSSSDSDDGSLEVEKNIMIVENAPVVDLVEADVTIADGPIEVTHTTPVTKLDDPVTECVSEAGEGKIVLLNEKVTVDSGASADSSVTPDVELGQKDKDEAKLSVLEESGRLREVAKGPTPEVKDEDTSTQLEITKELAPDNGKYENIIVAATSDASHATESAVNKNEEKLTLSYNPPRVDTTEDAEHSQGVASAIRPDQSTSWKSCCGLFEAFTGTSR
ncbi:hypothetical protein LIER_31492 [Lithospermum erythrorhizon]|uniref:Uncharacterized protein n=1 Tax=Lithospermum erythrorhizon TaxID=34254 RepID=A0AAV3RUS6_LITER